MNGQNRIVLNALRKGSLTPLDAWSRLGVSRLASRVYDLREAGYQIKSDRLKVRARGSWTFVAKYSLV